ncbi:alcohol dehydrogenase catalytic domain-containing protein [Paenibacillus validus]|uniref:Alcohol dehydrogenase catalytic domain-containing protein n=1 Tax=Paenibacillus validus TaxID=44253 RepID=A0A7X2Z8E1_9BACL|nr:MULTISPECIES: alcohol dehydrogenase catalytic domain-containing protein [Paenibacillus]MED4602218.1 alcohol dehydrogenase catalytic domain-containing protein [Paenibacillus validus]MED4607384.1 alcohol dehydrogenase catalytic domain-containing protein [Paenibacillus validus]MUG70230.1 alcohol dehydrogenase catalytic domain-containing protein [Paenibacillus validus]
MSTETFAALLLHQPGVMEYRHVERPHIGDREVLVKVYACGICGTDRHIYHGTYPASFPVTIGHEFAGVVEQIGKDIRHTAVGDFVSVNPNRWCGNCVSCLEGVPHLCSGMTALGVDVNGGLSVYCAVPEELIYKMKPGTDPLKACLAEPVSCVLHGLDRLQVKAGYRGAVFGGGFIGQLMLQAMRLQGASEVTLVEPQAIKRNVAEKLGFRTIDPVNEKHKIKELIDLDVTVDCAGAGDVLMQCMKATKRGGDILLFAAYPENKAVAIEPFEVFRKELRIIGSFTYPDTQVRAIRMIESGQFELDPIISELSLEDVTGLLEGKRDQAVIKGVVRLP